MLKNSRNRAKKSNPLSSIRLLHAVAFYYQKHNLFIDNAAQDKELKHLTVTRNLKKWIDKNTKGILMIPYDSKEDYANPSSWWIENQDAMSELSRFSCFLLDCSVQEASCKRMFKDISCQSTKGRIG
jgi:hypothetical protein